MCLKQGVEVIGWGSQHTTLDNHNQVKRTMGRPEEEEMRRWSVKFCSQAFTIVLCMSASQWSGKEATQG